MISRKRLQLDSSCKSTKSEALQGLEKFFPHLHGFREGQEEVISSLLRGENAAAIFPTGGGKSLCYQLSGMMLAAEGMTLVVSPLLALMKDQVDSMKALGHPVDLIASSQSLEEKINVRKKVQSGQIVILYLAPEQLNNENTVALLRSVKIALLAIDEAHCISEWGHAFRPDFLRLAKFYRDENVKRILALTATATPQVEREICSQFDIPETNSIRTAFFRPNLEINFTSTSQGERDTHLVRSIQSQKPGATQLFKRRQRK